MVNAILKEHMNHPAFKIGDIAEVHYGTKEWFVGCQCGNTEVTGINSKGSIFLANGFVFNRDGTPHARNRAMIVRRSGFQQEPEGSNELQLREFRVKERNRINEEWAELLK